MSLIYQERSSLSPYVEQVIRGQTTADDAVLRPSETHWHMVFVRQHDRTQALFVAPKLTSGIASWEAEADILWIKFKLGTFMPHLSPREFLDCETILPEARGQSFWLNSQTWQVPDYENVETFIDRLVRGDALARDPVVDAVLHDCLPADELASRTVRHRFLRATGLTQTHIYQARRAAQAAALLRNGMSILDTVHELGYFDQPHLTRSLKRFIGKTPAQQLVRRCQPE